ncbi:MAG: carboxylating nicotinate-nucleotide diphosphorylase [Pseudomonadota bacterium]
MDDRIVGEMIARALKEDLGDAGDITSAATIPADKTMRASIVARQAGIVAGLPFAEAAFRAMDEQIELTRMTADGDALAPGDPVLTISGKARAILSAERVALNFLGHLSGIATATRQLVDAVAGTGAAIVCTRKTTPGLRAAEKYAVRCGGGTNHRFGLYDAAMIKDNHVAAAGGVGPALKAARAQLGHLVKIEVEIDHLDQLDPALDGGADVVMLDNMSIDDMKAAVEKTAGRAVLEASGNVTLKTVRAIAETGVDVISSGAITHSAPSLDLGLDVK